MALKEYPFPSCPDVRIDQKRVHLGVDVSSRSGIRRSIWLGNLNFTEILSKVLVYDTVTVCLCQVLKRNDLKGRRGKLTPQRRKPRPGDEESLVLGHTLPIIEIMSKIELPSSPETCLSLLVHVPDILVLDGEQNERFLFSSKATRLELSVHLLLLYPTEPSSSHQIV